MRHHFQNFITPSKRSIDDVSTVTVTNRPIKDVANISLVEKGRRLPSVNEVDEEGSEIAWRFPERRSWTRGCGHRLVL